MKKPNGKVKNKISKKSLQGIKNIVVISDIHSGCQLALMPPTVTLDSGGKFHQSHLQKKLWEYWKFFWETWVPRVTKGEPYVIVFNGDAIEGSHHGAVTQITQNIKDQVQIAYDLLKPQIDKPKCKGLYFIKGTEAHVGKSGQAEEGLAKALGAIPDEIGNHARWEMFMRIDKYLAHFTHHTSSTSSASYETTGVWKEFIEACVESARQGFEVPDVIVRSHRHRECTIPVSSSKGSSVVHISPSWQLKTPFVYKLGMKIASPQIGGSCIKVHDEDGVYILKKVWHIERPKTVVI